MWPALIAGAAAAAGSIIGNQNSAQQADHAMDRQMEASNTAHQREVADLRLAGLNPILSANSQGASGISGQVGTVDNPGKGIADAANTAVAIRSQEKEFEAKDATIGNLSADTKNKMANMGNIEEDTRNKRASRSLIENQAQASAQEVKNKAMANTLLQKTLDAQIKKARAEGDYSEVNQIMGIINSGANSAGAILDIGNAAKSIKSLKGLK